MTRYLLLLPAVALGAVLFAAIHPSHITARPSPQCQTAAMTAAAVLAHNAVFGGLIDAIEAAPVRGADKPAVKVDGSLGPFDHRVPSLTACIGGR